MHKIDYQLPPTSTVWVHDLNLADEEIMRNVCRDINEGAHRCRGGGECLMRDPVVDIGWWGSWRVRAKTTDGTKK